MVSSRLGCGEEEIVRARGKGEGKREGTCGFGGRGDAFDGEAEIVERAVGVAGGVLDGASDESGFGGEADGFGDGFRRVTEAVLEVGGDG